MAPQRDDLMLRASPHLDDPEATAGGDGTDLKKARSKAPGFNASPAPPGADALENEPTVADDAKMFHAAENADVPAQGADDKEEDIDFLQLVREANQQAKLYQSQARRRGWTQSYRAFHGEHFDGSKYFKTDWRNRSKLFVPKTRAAIRKDMAAVSASMFGSINAISCEPGDEASAEQRGAAAVMAQLVNYRTDRTSGRASFPWFAIAMGSRQDSLLTGICLSKQHWKLDLKRRKEMRPVLDDYGQPVLDTYTGEPQKEEVEVWNPEIDRPDCKLIPPENYDIDPAADWTNPVQSAAYVIIRWPMQISEVREMEKNPLRPWHHVTDSLLRGASESGRFEQAAIRRAREGGLDRMDETQTGQTFQIVWVSEVFMRVGGEDYTFFSAGDRTFLTDPEPVESVYPEQYGERPLCLGYGSLEAHRIFPMSPVESWQPFQVEINDIRNLALDALKQNVMPVTKVVRGKQVDLDQLRRRSHGTAIMVTDKDDVTWEKVQDISQGVPLMSRALELELDDLSGQFNAGTTQNNNALSRTLGGLKLVAGSANAVQEMDIRIWIETWAEPVLAQIVRLEQYYENDPIVLGIAGAKAQLMQKHGISEINDELLENDVTVRISVGLGAGDPQQRLAKFATAAQIVMPILQASPAFMRGEKEVDDEAVCDEVFGSAGFRDGGKRFFKKGSGKPNPLGDLPAKKLQSEIDKNNATGKAALFTGLSALAKVALGDRAAETADVNAMLEHQFRATEMGAKHGGEAHGRELAETEAGHQHGLALREHEQSVADGDREHDRADQDIEVRKAEAAAAPAAGGGKTAKRAAPAPKPAPDPRLDQIIDLLEELLSQRQQGGDAMNGAVQ